MWNKFEQNKNQKLNYIFNKTYTKKYLMKFYLIMMIGIEIQMKWILKLNFEFIEFNIFFFILYEIQITN